MKVIFIYPAFERHADAHPELRAMVPCNEYIGPPSLGMAYLAAHTPIGWDIEYIDDRLEAFDANGIPEADLYALSVFTPAATRAFQIADTLRADGRTVVLGGIFPTMMPDVAAKHCDAVVLGEGEAVWPHILSDVQRGELKPRYEMRGFDLDQLQPPRVELYLDAERPGYEPDDYPLQLSRGCPLTCDACVLPIQLGNAMRFHSPQSVAETMRTLSAAGKLISLTEDTSSFAIPKVRRYFSRFLNTCEELQREGVDVKLSYLGISMPLVLNLDPAIMERLSNLGMDRFYLVTGFDPVSRNAFGTGDKNAWRKAVRSVERCHDFGLDPYVSFLAGNPDDDEGVFDRMLDFAQQARVDLAEFCLSTPYPGTPIWKRYLLEERIFDFDWKHYNDANVVFRPHKMSSDRLQEGYFQLWREFYRGRDQQLGEREHARRTIQF